MNKRIGTFQLLQQSGLILVILLIGVALTILTPTHLDRETGRQISNFLNPDALMHVATQTAFFAIMAVGITTVVISGGIDLSVGAIYALAGITMALGLGAMPTNTSPVMLVLVGLLLAVGTGILAGFLNGAMVAKLGVHPFIITLGTMWVYRGVAFVSSKANSLPVPEALTNAIKATLGLRRGLFPVPLLVMIAFTFAGWFFLTKTTMGRRIFAVGGNVEASRYAGLRIGRILTGVYVLSGLAAGLAAFVGISFYGSSSSNDANGYELYVIASTVVGGASLTGGKGSAWGALFGALLIIMFRTAIQMLRLDQNYEWIIIGIAIVVAVVLDRWGNRVAERRLARMKA